ncbi:hypothetical protein [Desulfobacula toluolica]|uniref:Uncharacterized protein n=1 Tax=Desulfobacula toluolica (strain DSM 7467 / Tol2) TaxID=651182 RepID=K0NIS7_DESTT|nr:hypothetical protein [Desulfobacula toluolica]CCK80835.1 uncharacterized protein TOL2_C26760 [Desulfobacula toluolica Tol2]
MKLKNKYSILWTATIMFAIIAVSVYANLAENEKSKETVTLWDNKVIKNISPKLENICKWITYFLTERHQYEKQCVRKHLYVRNDGNGILSIPLLEGPKMLTSGTRPFYLTWQGGKPAYQIRLYHQYERRPFIIQKLVENNLKIDNIILSQGNYIIKIEDAENRKLKKEFTVVNPNLLPCMPDEDRLRQSGLNKAAKITLYAAWLAAQNDGKWIFESYQRIAGITGDYYPASLLCNALAEGQRPALFQGMNNE